MSKYKIGDLLKFSNGEFYVADIVEIDGQEYMFVVENKSKLRKNESIGVMYLKNEGRKGYMTIEDEKLIDRINVKIAAKGMTGGNALINDALKA